MNQGHKKCSFCNCDIILMHYVIFKGNVYHERCSVMNLIELKIKKNLNDMNIYGFSEFKKGYQRAVLELKSELKEIKEKEVTGWKKQKL